MAASNELFQMQLIRRLVELAADHARPAVAEASSQLERGMMALALSAEEGIVHLPHYWAKFINYGRGPLVPFRSVNLVWFKDPQDDPRLSNGQAPVHTSQIRQLSPGQYRYWMEQNRIYYKNNPHGQDPPMIRSKWVGPMPGKHFFSNKKGMAGFDAKAGEEATRMFREHVRDALEDVWNIEGEVTVRI